MRLLVRNGAVALIGLAFGLAFWFGRLDWDLEMRLWRAIGDASLLLLFMALAIGPAARLIPSLGKLVVWRRELGVWFGLSALLHTLLILNGWAHWDIMRFLGYEYVPQLGRMARLEPGFGLSNLLGLLAMLLTLVLMATSTDRAMSSLGASAWKLLQLSSFTVFYLSALHTAYFLFMHYTASFHRSVPDDPNWFRWPFLLLTLGLMALQAAAYVTTVRQRRRVRAETA